jgi:hypothetical protein
MNIRSKAVVTGLVIAGLALAERNTPTTAASLQRGENSGNYDIAVVVSEADGRTTWKYTITNATPDTKNLGHFILDLANCGGASPRLANIVAATVDGVDWLAQLEGSEGRTGCEVSSDNFVKFDNLPTGGTHVIEFTLDGVYPPMDAQAWLKAGQTCLRRAVLGPGCKDYRRTTVMNADVSLAGKLYAEINTYMRKFGFDYTEHPNCTGGYGGHIDGVHGAADLDPVFNAYVFRFDIHTDPVIDGDRCSSSTVDRQRNEMKSITNNSTWSHVQGNWDEWQILEWKFKLPVGFQPTQNFGHIHQLKAQDGSFNDSPVITITARANTSGDNRRIQIIHSVDGASTGKGTIVDNVPLADFEGEWVQVREEVHYTHDGSYSAKITRISDGKVLIDFMDDNIDMWRIGSSYIRSKFGIYRSLGAGRLNRVPVGQNPLLKNESLWTADFRIYEKNANPTPGVPHE